MSGVAISAAVDRIVNGEMDIIFTPRDLRPGKRPVFLFHGQLRTAQDWNDTAAWPGSTTLAVTLARLGLVVIAAYWSGPTWGSPAFRAEVETARTYAGTLGAATDKFAVVGASMGAFEALSLAQHVPSEVACGVVTIPAVDLDYFRDNDIASARANINTAYGLTAGSTSATVPLPSDANVALPANAAAITSPFKFYGSSGDTTAPWSQATTLAGRIGAAATDVNPTGGHSDATIASIPMNEVAQFVWANA